MVLTLNGINMNEFIEKIKIKKIYIDYFKKITKDNNPIHFNSKFAKKLGYKDKVIQGMLTSSFISKIIGNKIPGHGSLWTGLSINFVKPVYLNDVITFKTKVLKLSQSTKTAFLSIVANNQKKEIILDAEVQVKYPIKFEKKFLKNNKDLKKIKIEKKSKIATLIIGASSQIGTKLIKKIKKNNLVISTYNNKKSFLKENKKNLIIKKLNLLDKKNINKFIKYIKQNFTINKLVFLPAGKIKFGEFNNTKVQDLVKEFNLQISSLFLIAQKLEKNFKYDSSIVIMGSDVTKNKPPQKMMIYNIIKSTLVSLAKNLAVELSYNQIRVNSISPGLIETDLTNNIPEISKEFYRINSLTNKLTTTDDVVNLILFLLSNKSKNINGANLSINGGYSLD